MTAAPFPSSFPPTLHANHLRVRWESSKRATAFGTLWGVRRARGWPRSLLVRPATWSSPGEWRQCFRYLCGGGRWTPHAAGVGAHRLARRAAEGSQHFWCNGRARWRARGEWQEPIRSGRWWAGIGRHDSVRGAWPWRPGDSTRRRLAVHTVPNGGDKAGRRFSKRLGMGRGSGNLSPVVPHRASPTLVCLSVLCVTLWSEWRTRGNERAVSGAAGGGISSMRPERTCTLRRPVSVRRYGVKMEVQGWGGE